MQKNGTAVVKSVVATQQITEPEFKGEKTRVAARKGDRGEVVDTFTGGELMVRWERSGKVCDATLGENCAAQQ